MLTYKSWFKRPTPVEVLWDFTGQYLNLSFCAKLGYLQKIYKNHTFWRYTLHNLNEQVLQTHCLTFLLNWLKNYCSQKNIDFIQNSNIMEEHLGIKKLHLNKKVTLCQLTAFSNIWDLLFEMILIQTVLK